MRFSRSRAISPIIATLLLIAIAVASGILVYIYVNSISGSLTQGGGSQVSERLQMQSYNFVNPVATCACSGQVLDIELLNTGGGSTTISAVYYDGLAYAQGASLPTVDTALAATTFYPIPATTTFTSGTAGDIRFSTATGYPLTTFASQTTGQIVLTFTAAPTAGTSHTVKVVSITGGTYVFSVVAGRTG